MPTFDRAAALRLADVADVVADYAFGATPSDTSIGLEVEVFPMRTDGGSCRRVPIHGRGGAADVLDRMTGHGLVTATDGPAAARWRAGSGRLTFEPGGQLEFSTGVHGTPAAALDEVDNVLAGLAGEFRHDGISLASAGHDAWTDLDDVPQQLAELRYRTMDHYLAARGGGGRRMMRHTASLQVNVDPGRGERADLRWRLTNLVAPMLVASFASSPTPPPDPAVSVRARTWRNLDPSRTGIPNARRLGTPTDRVADLVAFALDADVLLLRTPDGGALPGTMGFDFGRWLAHGHRSVGWPTPDDLREHLSTLFVEVRPRGALELRSIDALPARWRAVPLVLLAGLLLHGPTADHVLGLLEPTADRLPDRLARAGEVGLKDPQFCAQTVEVWSYARAGAAALPEGSLRPQDLADVDRFIDQFTLRGRCPADELREMLAADPRDALAMVSEPTASLELV